jgi:hypothetical protein
MFRKTFLAAAATVVTATAALMGSSSIGAAPSMLDISKQVGAKVGRTSLVESSGAADPMGRTRALIDQMKEKGWLSMPVALKEHDVDHSPASAEFDFTTGTCNVLVSPKLFGAGKTVFESGLPFKFMIYHEVSHCEMHRSPKVFWTIDALNRQEADLLDEQFLMHAMDDDADRRLNFHLHLHEVYADLRAAAMLLAEGHSPEELSFIIVERTRNAMDEVHDSSRAMQKLLAGASKTTTALSTVDVDVLARRLSAEHVLKNIYAKRLTNLPGYPVDMRNIFRSQLQTAAFNLKRSGKVPEGAVVMFGNGIDHPEGMKDQYKVLSWLFSNMKSIPTYQSDEFFVDAWIKSVFGETDPFKTLDEIAIKLEPMMTAYLRNPENDQ